MLFIESSPTRLRRTPKKPANTPLVIEPFERAAITVIAKRMIKNFSIAENFMAIFASGGVRKARTMSEIIPPKNDAVIPILRARSDSPRLAIG